MKIREKRDLFTKSAQELNKLLIAAREDLFNFKLDLTQNKLKNTRSIFHKRKEVALILTVLKEKELANAKNA